MNLNQLTTIMKYNIHLDDNYKNNFSYIHNNWIRKKHLIFKSIIKDYLKTIAMR
jgi:hypothetical protein